MSIFILYFSLYIMLSVSKISRNTLVLEGTRRTVFRYVCVSTRWEPPRPQARARIPRQYTWLQPTLWRLQIQILTLHPAHSNHEPTRDTHTEELIKNYNLCIVQIISNAATKIYVILHNVKLVGCWNCQWKHFTGLLNTLGLGQNYPFSDR